VISFGATAGAGLGAADEAPRERKRALSSFMACV